MITARILDLVAALEASGQRLSIEPLSARQLAGFLNLNTISPEFCKQTGSSKLHGRYISYSSSTASSLIHMQVVRRKNSLICINRAILWPRNLKICPFLFIFWADSVGRLFPSSMRHCLDHPHRIQMRACPFQIQVLPAHTGPSCAQGGLWVFERSL